MTTLVSELDVARFQTEVVESPETVLLEFRTAWCPPCRMLAPVLEQLAAEHSERLRIFTVDTEQSQAFARGFNIQAVPTMVVYRGGREVKRMTGLVSKGVLASSLGLDPA